MFWMKSLERNTTQRQIKHLFWFGKKYPINLPITFRTVQQVKTRGTPKIVTRAMAREGKVNGVKHHLPNGGTNGSVPKTNGHSKNGKHVCKQLLFTPSRSLLYVRNTANMTRIFRDSSPVSSWNHGFWEFVTATRGLYINKYSSTVSCYFWRADQGDCLSHTLDIRTFQTRPYLILKSLQRCKSYPS